MKFSKKLKEFFDSKGLTTNRDRAKAIKTHEQVFGRWMDANKPSALLIERLKQNFPDVPLGYLLTENEDLLSIINEPNVKYDTNPTQLIEEIEDRLNKLKKLLAQNCHNK